MASYECFEELYEGINWEMKAYLDITIEEVAELAGRPYIEDEDNVEAMMEYIKRCKDEYTMYVWEHMNSGSMIFNYTQWLSRNYDDLDEYNQIRFHCIESVK